MQASNHDATAPRDPEALLTDAQVGELLGICRQHVWTLTKRGTLPRPIRLGKAVRWRRRAILEAIDTLEAAARDAALLEQARATSASLDDLHEAG